MLKKGLPNKNRGANGYQRTMSDRFGKSSENLKQIKPLPENVNFIFLQRVLSEKMEKVAGSFSGSTVLPAQPKNLKLKGLHFFDVFYEIIKRKYKLRPLNGGRQYAYSDIKTGRCKTPLNTSVANLKPLKLLKIELFEPEPPKIENTILAIFSLKVSIVLHIR